MELNPKTPPGRSNRKARAFAMEIARLSREGYTSKAIREALADAGVIVSKSTVQREVVRVSCQLPRAARRESISVVHPPSPTSSPPQHIASHQPGDEPRSGKDIAERFMQGRSTNPLIRAKESR